MKQTPRYPHPNVANPGLKCGFPPFIHVWLANENICFSWSFVSTCGDWTIFLGLGSGARVWGQKRVRLVTTIARYVGEGLGGTGGTVDPPVHPGCMCLSKETRPNCGVVTAEGGPENSPFPAWLLVYLKSTYVRSVNGMIILRFTWTQHSNGDCRFEAACERKHACEGTPVHFYRSVNQ